MTGGTGVVTGVVGGNTANGTASRTCCFFFFTIEESSLRLLEVPAF